MIRATLSSLWAHKARMAMTGLAVALGVAFVVGTIVFRDTLEATFDDAFAVSAEGVDVTVTAAQDFSGQMSQEQGGGVPPEVVERIEAVDGVRVAEGEVMGFAVLVVDGEPVGGQGAPTLAVNAPSEESLRDEDLRRGRYPETGDEIALDAATVRAHDIEVGDRVDVVVDGQPEERVVTGVVGFGELDTIAGATVIVLDRDTAMAALSDEGEFHEVSVGAAEGVGEEELRDRIAAELDDGYSVRTGAQAAADNAEAVSEQLGFFTTGLLVFAGVSLFVGAFIIANTFSIVVAQRTRELALLRAVGASRRQVLGAVLLEALVVGLVGSLVGVALGLGLALGLQALLDALGVGLPSGGLVLSPDAVVAGLAVGMGVTVLAAVLPAAKATRIPPVAALTAASAPPPPRAGAARIAVGALLTVIGVGLLALGLFGDGGITVVGAGAGVVLIGLSLLAALVARPVLAVAGWPLARLLAIRGQLARQNALRNPRRTAATASALMIGLGLVSFASIFGASITRSAGAVIEESFRAEFVVQGPTQMVAAGLGDDLSERLDELDEVATASPGKFTEFEYDGESRFALGVDPDTIERALSFGAVEGSIGDLGGGGVAIRHDTAERLDLDVGDEIEIALPRSGAQTLPVRAVFDAAVDVDWVLDNETVVAGNREAPDQQIWVKLADGVDAEEARPALEAVVDEHPVATLRDHAEQQAEIADQVNQLLALMSALLLLSVLIALLGIVNTLSLSVFERTAELGLLRAVGATRRQVRAMIRWESVLISVLGAVLGLGVGVLFGWLVVSGLADYGVTRFALPGWQLLLGFVAAAVAGVLAAVLPARRAARVDVLRAIAAD